jgi:hypothetical protein
VARLDGAPADGNGHKRVDVFSFESTVTCPDGVHTLTRVIAGWVQYRVFGEGSSRTVELDVFHRTFTFTNAAGDVYKEQDVGPVRYWVQDGHLFVANVGRIVGLWVGTFVVDLDTGETIFEAGQELEPARRAACEKLF